MSPVQTQTAKITPLVLTDIIPRKRLFHLLDRAMKKPVAWVSAPGRLWEDDLCVKLSEGPEAALHLVSGVGGWEPAEDVRDSGQECLFTHTICLKCLREADPELHKTVSEILKEEQSKQKG